MVNIKCFLAFGHLLILKNCLSALAPYDPPDGVSLSERQLPVSLGLEVVERLAERHPGHWRGHAARGA